MHHRLWSCLSPIGLSTLTYCDAVGLEKVCGRQAEASRAAKATHQSPVESPTKKSVPRLRKRAGTAHNTLDGLADEAFDCLAAGWTNAGLGKPHLGCRLCCRRWLDRNVGIGVESIDPHESRRLDVLRF